MTHTASLRRQAVTLVELLVVMALMIVLAGLAVAVSQSGVFGSQRVISGADRASGWLLISKQRAMRDGLPRGVRFLLNPVRDPLLNPTNDPNYFAATEAQYIESPEPWPPNPNGDHGGPRLAFVYFTTGTTTTPPDQVPNFSTYRAVYYVASDFNEFDQRVMIDDLILLPDERRVCRIKGITNASVTIGGSPLPAKRLLLDDGTYPDLGANNSGPLPSTPPPSPQACKITYSFAFQPAPRPLIGEPTLQLTGGTIIDCRITPTLTLANPSTTFGVAPTGDGAGGFYFDVLFAPSGNVMYTPGGIVCLWVRDPEKTPHPRWDLSQGPAGIDSRLAYDAAGEQALVTVYTHTGVIATHPPSYAPQTQNDPYRYAKDGINSGL